MPLVALPCGSPSIKRVRFSAAARLAARLTAVVVFPTPPFWFAIAITRPTISRLEWVSRRLCFSARWYLNVRAEGWCRPIYPGLRCETTCHVAQTLSEGSVRSFPSVLASFRLVRVVVTSPRAAFAGSKPERAVARKERTNEKPRDEG